MTDYEEALDDFSTENSNKTAEAMVGSFRVQNQQMNGQLQVESLQKFHHSLMG